MEKEESYTFDEQITNIAEKIADEAINYAKVNLNSDNPHKLESLEQLVKSGKLATKALKLYAVAEDKKENEE